MKDMKILKVFLHVLHALHGKKNAVNLSILWLITLKPKSQSFPKRMVFETNNK